MKPFIAVFVVLIIFFAVVVLLLLYYIRKGIMKFKQHLTGDYDEETFKRMADKHYRGNGEGPQFDKNYFKGSGSKRKGSYRAGGASNKQSEQTERTTVTREGTTIIDDRSQDERKQKIFTKDEGEYVDFVEEK